MKGEILAINISKKRGEKKTTIAEAFLEAGHGIQQDAHAGDWHRQVSLLSLSSFEKMREKGADIIYGDFAENISVGGMDVMTLPTGTRFTMGGALLEVTQIGKECHNGGCPIRQHVGSCVMPIEGIFAKVLESGRIKTGDGLEVI
jgi:MOSC domain-containing protein YiiM